MCCSFHTVLTVGLLLTHIRLGCCIMWHCNVYSAAGAAPLPCQSGAEAATYAAEAGLESAAFPCTVTGVWQAVYVLWGAVRAVYVCCPGCCPAVHACSALVVAVVAALIPSDALAVCYYTLVGLHVHCMQLSPCSASRTCITYSVYTISVSTCLLRLLDILCVWDEPRAVAWPLDGGSHTYLHGAGCNTNLRVAQQQLLLSPLYCSCRMFCLVSASCGWCFVLHAAYPDGAACGCRGLTAMGDRPCRTCPSPSKQVRRFNSVIIWTGRAVSRVCTVPRSGQCYSMLLARCCIVHYRTRCTNLFS
jgi:hypothetical protein